MLILPLEASINDEIAISVKMAGSPLIQRYLLNPADSKLKKIALEEIAEYRRAFAENNVFWISGIDKKYYFGDEYVYTLDPSKENSQWYNALIKNQIPYSLNVNFDIGIKKTLLWINALVLDDNHKEDLYLFNAAGEITGAKDVVFAENKANITQ
jgi:methyl-accepting chemotaxis protein